MQLHNNPFPPLLGESDQPPRSIQRPKMPRTPEDSEWSLIPLAEHGICIHLFTVEGRERWDLEELWGAGGSAFRQPPAHSTL